MLIFAILIAIGIIAPIFWKPSLIAATGKNKQERIITLSPNITEIAYALDLNDRIAGVSSDSDYPKDANQKPKMGSFWQPNIESIIAAKPDLAICETFLQHKETAETLKRTGINVLALRLETIEELYSAIEQMGTATNSKNKADLLNSTIQNSIKQIRNRVIPTKRVKVLWAIQTEPIRLAGVKTFINEIINIAGGENVIPLTGDQYPSIGTETIMTCGADVIIQSAMGKEDLKKQQLSAEIFWSKFVNMPAVKNKKIYVIESDTVLRLGPRLPQGAMIVAKLLHPEIFAQVGEPNTR